MQPEGVPRVGGGLTTIQRTPVGGWSCGGTRRWESGRVKLAGPALDDYRVLFSGTPRGDLEGPDAVATWAGRQTAEELWAGPMSSGSESLHP